jgi:hypothetical protein
LAIASSTRKAPNVVASTSGSKAIAKTFHRTGQLRSDHARGRLGGGGAAGGAGAKSGGTAATAVAGRANIVTCARPRRGPHPLVAPFVGPREMRNSLNFLLYSTARQIAANVCAWQSDEYDSPYDV